MFRPTLSIICADIDNSSQVHIPQRRPSQSFVFKIKCRVTSNTTHGVLINKEISYKSFKEICSEEPTKVNLGYRVQYEGESHDVMKVENNSLVQMPHEPVDYIYGYWEYIPYDWVRPPFYTKRYETISYYCKSNM